MKQKKIRLEWITSYDMELFHRFSQICVKFTQTHTQRDIQHISHLQFTVHNSDISRIEMRFKVHSCPLFNSNIPSNIPYRHTNLFKKHAKDMKRECASTIFVGFLSYNTIHHSFHIDKSIQDIRNWTIFFFSFLLSGKQIEQLVCSYSIHIDYYMLIEGSVWTKATD